jgi:tripartite-type tricarboxylate transporter receptor subunit TctC
LLVNALADTQNLHYLSVPYDAINDFALVDKIADGPPLVLIVNAKSRYRKLDDIIADARANPNKVSFGTSGPETRPPLRLVSSIHWPTKIAAVPYRGTGPAAAAVINGEIQAAFVFYSNPKPPTDNGRVRAIAITTTNRTASWPAFPTRRNRAIQVLNIADSLALRHPRPRRHPLLIS